MSRSRNEIVINPNKIYFPETGGYIERHIMAVQGRLKAKETWRQGVVGDRDGDMMDEKQLTFAEQDQTMTETALRQAQVDLKYVPQIRPHRSLPNNRIDIGDVIHLAVEVKYMSANLPEQKRFHLPERMVLGKKGDAIYLRGNQPFDGDNLDIIAEEAVLAKKIIGQKVGFDFEMRDDDFEAHITVTHRDVFRFPLSK